MCAPFNLRIHEASMMCSGLSQVHSGALGLNSLRKKAVTKRRQPPEGIVDTTPPPCAYDYG